MVCYIYKTTNKVNGRIYVGQRISSSLKDPYLGSGKVIKKAFKKYGRKNFCKGVLEVCEEHELDEKEIYWIARLKANDRKVGYNIALGGVAPMRGQKHSEEARSKIREALLNRSPDIYKGVSAKLKGHDPWSRGRKHTAEERKKISDGNMGHEGFWKGKKLSEETKLKLSEVRMGKKRSPDTIAKTVATRKKKDNYCHTEETKFKISESLKGNIPWNRGKKVSEEERRRMSERMTGKKMSEETKRKISEAHKKSGLKPPPSRGRKGYWSGKKMPPRSEAWRRKISETLKKRGIRPPEKNN